MKENKAEIDNLKIQYDWHYEDENAGAGLLITISLDDKTIPLLIPKDYFIKFVK